MAREFSFPFLRILRVFFLLFAHDDVNKLTGKKEKRILFFIQKHIPKYISFPYNVSLIIMNHNVGKCIIIYSNTCIFFPFLRMTRFSYLSFAHDEDDVNK